MNDWIPCTTLFSNGTEYEIFLEHCAKCTRYRTGRCRIVYACEMARIDARHFPYKDLEDNARYAGKRCKHYTSEIQRRKAKNPQLDGQVTFEELIKAEPELESRLGMGGKKTEDHTICWDCQNACGDCSWSDHWKHEPVPGWKADRVPLKLGDGRYTATYIVRECPEFLRDTPRKPKNDKNGDKQKEN